MKKQIPKKYEPKKYEDKIYRAWEKSGFFQPKADPPRADNPDKIKSKKSYCNVLPPPNANGELHLGHASGYTVMDIFGRYHRMKGEKTLLLPGKDHAGILTQVVYERKLKEERNLTRYDLGREKFYKETYDFCIDRADFMREQEKKIGISADWKREKFTLDKKVSKTVLETFAQMHRDGMIYRGERIINWCPRCATALSDLEVQHSETDGKLYYIKYPIKDTKEFITVATTRPETMLGDTAVAVNPNDKKYKKLIGKAVILPLQDKEIPIISDRRIEMGFGTGAVKITPAHDPLDWKISQDHKLPSVQVINEKSKITAEGGKYAGQEIKKARENVLLDLEKLGLLEKVEDAKINISVCERCKTVIEPLVSKQWFLDVDAKKYSLKKKSLEVIKAGKIKVYPESFKKILIQWFSNLEDWCISRQLWWGHRMPVWYKLRDTDKEEICIGIKPSKGRGWTQEEDTFDTWFSSGQWAYSTLGYSDGKDYKNFYPTDMMVMGRDILFFWSARMIMLSLYSTGKIPFKNLYFTGLVRDKDGQKMSKSKGNGIDPLEMIEKYGADALRLSLVTDTTPGQDFRLYEEKIEKYRNFVTKLWNIYRYAASSDENFTLGVKISKKDLKTLSDRWIVSRLNSVVFEATKALEEKKLTLAENILINFTWNELADWYLETSKVEKNSYVINYVIGCLIKLWHPFMPFVTEKIYRDMIGEKKFLMVEKWPVAEKKLIDKKAEKEFEKLQEMITKIRNIRSSYRISPSVVISAFGKNIKNVEIVEKLALVKIEDDKKKKKSGVAVSARSAKLTLDISEFIDIEKEKSCLGKEIENFKNLISKTENLLKNKNFLKKAPKVVVAQNKTKLQEYREKLKSSRDLLGNLG